MGTSDFHNVNASRVFAATGMEESWEYDDFKTNVKSALGQLKYLRTDGADDPHELRSYPSEGLMTFYKSRSFEGFEVELKIGVICRSAYYDGVNLDWEPSLEINGCDADTEFIKQSLEGNTELTEKRVLYLEPFLKKWIDKTQALMVADIEKVFADWTTPLRSLGTASNGETFYEKSTI